MNQPAPVFTMNKSEEEALYEVASGRVGSRPSSTSLHHIQGRSGITKADCSHVQYQFVGAHNSRKPRWRSKQLRDLRSQCVHGRWGLCEIGWMCCIDLLLDELETIQRGACKGRQPILAGVLPEYPCPQCSQLFIKLVPTNACGAFSSQSLPRLRTQLFGDRFSAVSQLHSLWYHALLLRLPRLRVRHENQAEHQGARSSATSALLKSTACLPMLPSARTLPLALQVPVHARRASREYAQPINGAQSKTKNKN